MPLHWIGFQSEPDCDKKMQDAVNSTGLIVHVRICKTAETQMEWDREWEDQLILHVKIEFRLNFFNIGWFLISFVS